jgi:hypothetical protein
MRTFENVVVALMLCVTSVHAQCDGSCQANNETCSGTYKSGLCPGGNDIECCYETTPYCPGQCQSNNQGLTCQGSYQTDMCPGADDIQCCQGVQPFADRYWNCADVGCTSVVSSGSSQSGYQCAEFVARSLAAGGFIPGLSGLESQSSYDPYVYGGNSYDLLWVSDKQGGPLGLREFLMALGWSSSSTIQEGSAVMTDGAEGAYSHVAIGIAYNECDAHNNARYHITSCSSFYTVNEILNPPSAGDKNVVYAKWPVSDEPYIPHAERMEIMGRNNDKQAAN